MNDTFDETRQIMATLNMTTYVNGSQAHDLYGFAWYKRHERKTAVYLDVGTRAGNSAIIMASALKHQKTLEYGVEARVYTVDNYSLFVDKTKEEDIVTAKYNMSQFGIDDYLSIHVMDDIEFVNSLPDNSIDMVFDDSDHGYKQTYDRLNSYLSKLRDNSLVVVHDYYINYPGIVKAIDEVYNENRQIVFGLNYQNGFGWFFCKPNKDEHIFDPQGGHRKL